MYVGKYTHNYSLMRSTDNLSNIVCAYSRVGRLFEIYVYRI